jgi:glycosyltransferase involved in cell wall biosynthesis
MNARGRIAHILPFPGIGGTEIQTLRVAEAARSLGFANFVYYPEGAEKTGDLFRTEGFESEAYPQAEPSYRHPAEYVRASRKLARRLREHRIDIAHCADIRAAHFAGLAARLAGAHLICHVRNPYPDIARREQTFLYPVQLFLYISKAVERSLNMPTFRKRGKLIYDVPGAVPAGTRSRVEAREYFGLPPDCPVIGTAARLAAQKDYVTLIKAAKLVKQVVPNVRFLVAADTDGHPVHRETYAALQPLLDETGTRDAFHFAGFQSEMSWFYAAIDAFVLSSHWEGLGTVLLEAIAYGKTAVATAVDGIPEVIIDEETGLLAPPKSPGKMAAQLIRVLRDRELRERMIANAQRHLRETFGPERFSAQLDAIYSEVLRKR